MSNSDSPTEQTKIAPYMEMNRYDEREKEWPSAEVYEAPRRTLANGWAKFHAERDCGRRSVRFVESDRHRSVSEKYEFNLRCSQCGYEIPEEEVLFIGGDWYTETGWLEAARSIEDLWLPPERVLELGPNPEQDDLIQAIRLTRIEQKASVFGVAFGNEQYRECEDCGKETMVRFDDRCRMCYDGEWTERMQEVLNGIGISIRERNNSFVHRLEQNVDPFSIHDRAFTDKILWRRHAEEPAPKLVEVTQCLQDDADGHWEYILADLTHTEYHRYHEDDLADCFWDTGLYHQEGSKPVADERLRELYERVC